MTKHSKDIRSHINTLTESKSHLLFSLNLSLSYIQRAGPADPHELPLTSPSALCASWFRPAVAALAASGADPPHFNASDIYLGRTTGGRGGGGGGGVRTTAVDVDSPAVNFSHSTPPLVHFVFRAVFCLGDHVYGLFVSSV